MKNLLILLLLVGSSQIVMAQQEGWKELEDFHGVMSQTFHPAEDGNFKPIMERSGEMAQKAAVLKKSKIPTAYNKEGVKKSVALLAKESKALDKMVQRKKTEAEIKTALFALHDRFHEVMEKCAH
ncbi:MAG: hypothetical protein HUU34_05375 [Saprospiraceae bacterium]|nr:hypothetical protein [Saprospiraceae bacterium]